MFDENICVRLNSRGGSIKLAPSIHQVAICCFGPNQALSLVAISHTLNKLIVRDLSSTIKLAFVNNQLTFESATNTDKNYQDFEQEEEGEWSRQNVAYIAMRDVVNALSSKRCVMNNEAGASNTVTDHEIAGGRLTRDLLLIGCSSSIVVYDTYEQTNLFNINTSSKITALLSLSNNLTGQEEFKRSEFWSTIFGGGVQKLYSLQVEQLNPCMPTTSLDKLVNIEITSERSTSDTISCLCFGRFDNFELVLTGSSERKIRIYLSDTFDHNIQACKLTLNESSKVHCLCAIATVQPSLGDQIGVVKTNAQAKSSLPSIQRETKSNYDSDINQQTNHFAYGLENGFIGVYRLISTSTTRSANNADNAEAQWSLFAERLWRHKSRQVPVSIVMFDINGDGLEELVFGFSDGRLEARLPFTGQLVAKTRCFKSHGLVSLTLLRASNYHEQPLTVDESIATTNQSNRRDQVMLLACSSSMSLIGFWLQRCKPFKPLEDYLSTKLDDYKTLDYNRRLVGQSVDENDEEEDWMSSLSNLASLSTQVEANDADENILLETSPQIDIFGQELSSTSSQQFGGGALHAIEMQGDNQAPIACDCKQSGEQLQQISALYNDQAQFKEKLGRIYSERLQQLSLSELDSLTTSPISLAYRWDYDDIQARLRLSVMLKCSSGLIELFELGDKSCNLVKTGRLLINPHHEKNIDQSLEARASFTNLVIIPIKPFNQEAELKLDLRIYCQQSGTHTLRLDQIVEATRRNRMLPHPIDQESIVSRVYEKIILMPRFSMFIPEPADSMPSSHDMMKLAFKLDDNTSHLQILDWMRDNFLCFQFGQLFGAMDHETVWPSLDIDNLSGTQAQSKMIAPDQRASKNSMSNLLDGSPSAGIKQRAPFDHYENWSSGRTGPSGELELDLKLIDLRRLQASAQSTANGGVGRLRIAYSLMHVLTIECEDVDVLVAIIDSLIIDCLRLNIKDHLIVSKKEGCPKLDAMSAKLEMIASKTRQLEESERRIQTELYESSDMTKSLMQQFAIANQLNEFSTSRELLNEISMMLDGALNSAQAFQLNNQEKLKMSKEANHLREKMSFLLECT